MAKKLALALSFPCRAQEQFPYNGKTLQSTGKVVVWMLCSLGGHDKVWFIHQVAALLIQERNYTSIVASSKSSSPHQIWWRDSRFIPGHTRPGFSFR